MFSFPKFAKVSIKRRMARSLFIQQNSVKVIKEHDGWDPSIHLFIHSFNKYLSGLYMSGHSPENKNTYIIKYL